MTDFQPYLLLPFRDDFARKQFLIACCIMLAGTFIPLIPLLILLGYSARIMRQIIEEEREPSMFEWQGSNWGELVREGARMLAVRLVFGLPSFLLIGSGAALLLTGSFLVSSPSEGNSNRLLPPGGISLAAGLGILILALVISLPLAIMIGAAESHTVAKRSFRAGLRVKEWWPVFRNGLGLFLGTYLFMIAAGFILSITIRIATITVVLICVIPFVTAGFSTYLSLVMNALFANAYVVGRKAIEPAT